VRWIQSVWVFMFIAYRDKKVVSVFIAFFVRRFIWAFPHACFHSFAKL
jgi:hypothetical protein